MTITTSVFSILSITPHVRRFSGIVSPNPDMSVSEADILFYDDTEESSVPNTLQVRLLFHLFQNTGFYGILHIKAPI